LKIVRRSLLKLLPAMGLTVASSASRAQPMARPYRGEGLFLTTWRFGLTSNETAWRTIRSGGSLLDAIEQGIRDCELDPAERSVGLGGRASLVARRKQVQPASSRIISAARSPIRMQGALVLVETMVGMIDASATRNP
jgi:hypothetical protein